MAFPPSVELRQTPMGTEDGGASTEASAPPDGEARSGAGCRTPPRRGRLLLSRGRPAVRYCPAESPATSLDAAHRCLRDFLGRVTGGDDESHFFWSAGSARESFKVCSVPTQSPVLPRLR